jgi:hypothetical protein
MTPAAKVGLAIAGGVFAAGGALYYGGSGAPEPAPSGSVWLTVQAAPREVDEGDLVEFVATVADAEGSVASENRWDYGDGSPASTGLGLSDVRHRFVDDGSFRVAVRAGDAEASVTVRVRNVAPTIRRVSALVIKCDGRHRCGRLW